MLTTIAHTSLVIQCSSKEPPAERAIQRSHLSPHDRILRITGLDLFQAAGFRPSLPAAFLLQTLYLVAKRFL